MAIDLLIPESKGVAEFKIKISGAELGPSIGLLSVSVLKAVNKISMAKIVLKDGNPSDGKFEMSDGDDLIPGNEIEITAGDPDNQTSVFQGIVVKHSLRIRPGQASELVIECKQAAVKMTTGKKNAYYHDVKDSEVMETLLSNDGISDTDIEETEVTHKELVQFYCTDWDFLLARAEANGKLVYTNDEFVSVGKPDFSTEPVLTLQYGDSIFELDAEMDSRNQLPAAVSGFAWDPANQESSEADATDPAVPEMGNLSSSELSEVSGLDQYILSHGGALTTEELQAWADASLLRSRMSKIRGRVKMRGYADVNPGDMISLDGIGKRFSGNAFVTGVKQELNTVEGWRTHIQFGTDPDWFMDTNANGSDQKAGGLLPGVNGLHVGIVQDNKDEDGEYRVKVRMPFVDPADDGVWARVALTDAGDQRGLFFRPEVDDEVLLGFLHDDPRFPVILGMMHSSSLKSPIEPTDDNDEKGYTSREKLKMTFDDKKKSIAFETPGGNKVTMSDEDKKIEMEDQNGNKITMDDNGITIDSPKDVTIKGMNISAKANTGFKAEGSTVDIKSNGPLTAKGTPIQLN